MKKSSLNHGQQYLVSKVSIPDILGVFTNGDPDDVAPGLVETLKNFRPVNGKLVKTHGSADTGRFNNLNANITDYTITNVFTFSSDKLNGESQRTAVLKVNNKTNRLVVEMNNGF